MNFTFAETIMKGSNDFITNYGFYSKKINREEVPEFINYALSLNNQFIFDKISNEIEFYLIKCRKHKFGELINILFDYEIFASKLLSTFSSWRKLIVPTNVLLVLDSMLESHLADDIIAENIGFFLENVNSNEIEYKMLEILKKIPSTNYIINLIKHQQDILGNYSFLNQLNIGTFSHIFRYSMLDEVKNIFQAFSENNLSNVQFLANGSTSSVFLINNDTNKYVIKIGKKRFVFNSQFSPLLLQPYLRKEYKNENGDVICTIEIQDFCSHKIISDGELECIYADLLRDGCVWLDKDKSNIGTLLQPNTRKISESEDGFDYEGTKSHIPIGEIGDSVIIDNDLILSPQKCQDRHSVYNIVSNEVEMNIIIDCGLIKDLKVAFNMILNQIYNNYQIIFVNMNNIDTSIIDEYSKIDSRITKNDVFSSNRIVMFDYIQFSDPYYLYAQVKQYDKTPIMSKIKRKGQLSI